VAIIRRGSIQLYKAPTTITRRSRDCISRKFRGRHAEKTLPFLVKMAETTLESISAPSARPLSTPEPHPFSSPEPSPIKEEVVIESNEDKFNRLKDQGNKCVGKVRGLTKNHCDCA